MTELVQEFLASERPDDTIRDHVAAAIAERRGAAGRVQPHEPLELLLVGYQGAGNTGSDVRVIELVRQLRAIFGDGVGITLTTIGDDVPRDGMPGVREAFVDDYMPSFLARRCGEADVVVACEGSMFKSNFSNALATLMIGALGMASAEGKVGIGYGAEAAAMDPELQAFACEHATEALVVCRNAESQATLDALGLRTALGADPAWSYAPPEHTRPAVDGPCLAVCPVNPFWWPVRADVERARALESTGAHAEQHYTSVFFHEQTDDDVRAYEAYLDALAAAVRAVAREHSLVPVVVGMERLDLRACEDLAARLPDAPPPVVRGAATPAELVATLRASSLLVSSRYHAVVTALPALVPAVGVSMDERLERLLGELGRPDLCVRAALDAAALVDAMRAALTEREGLADAAGGLVAAQLRRLGEGGKALADETSRVYPGVGRPDARGWDAYLPLLPAAQRRLLDA